MLAVGAAYLVWEHGQGRHRRPHPLCVTDTVLAGQDRPETPGVRRACPAKPPEQA